MENKRRELAVISEQWLGLQSELRGEEYVDYVRPFIVQTERSPMLPKQVMFRADVMFPLKPKRRGSGRLGEDRKKSHPQPTVVELLENFSKATVKFLKSGMPVVDEAVCKARLKICGECEHWDGKARFGLGKCAHVKCGCTKLKHWMASEKCPIGKWAEEIYAKPTTNTNGNNNNDTAAANEPPVVSGENRAEGDRDNSVSRSGSGDRPGQRGAQSGSPDS